MILRKRTPFLAGLLACALLAGCHSESEPAGGTTGGTTSAQGTTGGGTGGGGGAGTTQLAFVTNNPSPYWVICHKGCDAAAKDLGVAVQFVMPADGSAAAQKQDVDDLISKGVKGIAISPVDAANETPYLNTIAAKTNLITSDSDAVKSNRLCYIGTDNHAAGVMAGGLIKEALPQGGKIILFVGKKDAQNAHDRETGIRDAIKGTQIQILDVRTDDSDQVRAKQNAADALTSTPDLAGMVGLWSYNGPAIADAVQKAGKVGKVKVICFDADPGTPEGIKSGTIYGTVVQDPYTFGYNSINLLTQLAKGDKSAIPANKLMIVPNEAIKSGNLDAYLAEQKKKMGA